LNLHFATNYRAFCDDHCILQTSRFVNHLATHFLNLFKQPDALFPKLRAPALWRKCPNPNASEKKDAKTALSEKLESTSKYLASFHCFALYTLGATLTLIYPKRAGERAFDTPKPLAEWTSKSSEKAD
jgi:hypothetical protein